MKLGIIARLCIADPGSAARAPAEVSELRFGVWVKLRCCCCSFWAWGSVGKHKNVLLENSMNEGTRNTALGVTDGYCAHWRFEISACFFKWVWWEFWVVLRIFSFWVLYEFVAVRRRVNLALSCTYIMNGNYKGNYWLFWVSNILLNTVLNILIFS